MQHQDPQKLRFQGENGRDEFHREQVAANVIQLLKSPIDVSPMVIDGDWGMGKTEFCHKLINKFKDEVKLAEKPDEAAYHLLYVDAFQADHGDNPLLTILAGLLSLFPENKAKKSLLKKATKVMRFAVTTAGKAGAAYLLKQNPDTFTDGLNDAVQDGANEAIDAVALALLKDHEKVEENLQALRDALATLVAEKPMVVFIDELDRCRPDFAVQMLEVIKHTFDVPGLQFVLVTNKRQLKAAIHHRYGTQVNAQRYLDKFLKFSFRLPDLVFARDRKHVAVVHLLSLLNSSEVLKGTAVIKQESGVLHFVQELVAENSLSLREVETLARYLEIYHQLSQGLHETYPFSYKLLNIFGVFIYGFHSEIAESVVKNRADADALAGLCGITALPDYAKRAGRTSHLQNMGVMLAWSCTKNRDKYKPALGDSPTKQYWDRVWQEYAEEVSRTPEGLQNPVKEAIYALQLGGAR